MRNKIWIVLVGAVIVIGIAGCGDSQNKVQPQYVGTAQSSLTRPFSDMLYGFTKIEKYVSRGDYSSATTISNNLYDEFHDAILPPLQAKKGKTYAEKMDKKYDELGDAIKRKDKAKITELINVNRDNLRHIAPMMGVSLLSF
ncbi:hypothetical protein HPT25_19605 [Bacillus sp. BRMEA1]|uniref:hypothetical protein n=1 Tax=Neobacillus endophyticus TaxID=2738405 RepID=UPI00156427C6|nr:hypothetical protein [Neobacillus endophyticus]NRD79570.1 hypothetical protein [Neobacillus endophyticus]